jgi:hypothetical protein
MKEIVVLDNIEIHIFDEHNQVLESWLEIYDKYNQAFSLVTFDFHNDTGGFDSNQIEYIDMINSKEISGKCKGFEIGEYISNDRHIFAAHGLGYLSSFHVISLTKGFDSDSAKGGYYYMNEKCLDCINLNSKEYCQLVCPNHLENMHQYRIDDRYLSKSKLDLNSISDPLILDFDLDYFSCSKSLKPKNIEILSKLVNRAKIITIAREKKYFEMTKIETSFTNDKALELLIALIKNLKY